MWLLGAENRFILIATSPWTFLMPNKRREESLGWSDHAWNGSLVTSGGSGRRCFAKLGA